MRCSAVFPGTFLVYEGVVTSLASINTNTPHPLLLQLPIPAPARHFRVSAHPKGLGGEQPYRRAYFYRLCARQQRGIGQIELFAFSAPFSVALAVCSLAVLSLPHPAGLHPGTRRIAPGPASRNNIGPKTAASALIGGLFLEPVGGCVL